MVSLTDYLPLGSGVTRDVVGRDNAISHAGADLSSVTFRIRGNRNSVEIDSTFYRMPSLKTIEGWKRATGENFKFTIKASQQITHFQRLKVPSEALDYFRTYLRFDTTNPPSNTTTAIGYVKSLLDHEGIATETFESKPGMVSIVAVAVTLLPFEASK